MSNILQKFHRFVLKWVHEVITHRENLKNINNAFEQMKAGDCIRFEKNTALPEPRTFQALLTIH